MAKKFHVAVFCSAVAYPERRAFYSATFGAPSHEGTINEGSEGHNYDGSMWAQQGLCFALLKKADLKGGGEQLAHVGLIFDTGAEFEDEIQRRSIDTQRIKVLSQGERQVFVPDENGIEWEFSCSETITS
jgi:catechol 2,3-dioxygenase-like lactoylglutathione lyase family enzyme